MSTYVTKAANVRLANCDASSVLKITVGATATAGDSLAQFSGKWVRMRAYGGPIYVAGATGLAASAVTNPTTEAGANPGILIAEGTEEMVYLWECPPQFNWYLKAISDGAGRTLVIHVASR